MAYTGYTQAQGKASIKYKRENLEEIRVTIWKGGKQALKSEAERCGMSMAEYICEAVNAKAGRLVISSKADEWAAVIAQNELEADMQAVISENLPAWKELANDQDEPEA